MAAQQLAPRTACLAGASGLVGSALIPLLLASPYYRHVVALLRASSLAPPDHPKLSVLRVDFSRLPALPRVDDLYIALGTTIKAAGSQAAFRLVDFDAVVQTARAARLAGATRLALVSAMGANAESAFFYNRIKGEVQEAVLKLGFDTVVIAQPSLLLGDRAALGQGRRFAESQALRLLRPFQHWIPRQVRPIAADAVALALCRAMDHTVPGVRLLDAATLHELSGT